jgi:prepilin-type N-terminal cleavage/methylation domain-containing protein
MQILKAGTSNKLSRGKAGFTLIELTVVILIITVISAVTLPRISKNIYSSDLKHSLRQLRSIFAVARSRTTADGIPRRIVCDIDKGQFRIEREVREEQQAGFEADELTVEYEEDKSVLSRSLTLPSEILIEDVVTEVGDIENQGIAYMRIEPNGIINGNRIHLKKEALDYTLVINPLTGRITIEDGYSLEVYSVKD